MLKIRTEFEFEAAHKLSLSYESPCMNLHGHSYRCAVTIRSDVLNKDGMIVDFKILKSIIKEKIENKLDHKFLNDVFGEVNSTAEYMVQWIAKEMQVGLEEHDIKALVVMVELNETSKNKAIWELD